jgi:hypothetical protein
VFAAGDVRRGSVNRVASAVGEGAATIPLVHRHLNTAPATPGRRGPAPLPGQHTATGTQPNMITVSNQEAGSEKDQDRRPGAHIASSSARGAPERFPRVQ